MAENQTPSDNGAAAENNEQQPVGFALQRVYINDSSFESPNTPDIFQKEWKPEFKMDLNTKNKKLKEEGFYEITVCITLTATVDGMTAYIAEVQQAGVFQIMGLKDMQLAQALGAMCPTILFPYLRETLDNLIVKGSFAPAMIAPVNFDAVFAQAMQKKQMEAQAAASGEVSH